MGWVINKDQTDVCEVSTNMGLGTYQSKPAALTALKEIWADKKEALKLEMQKVEFKISQIENEIWPY